MRGQSGTQQGYDALIADVFARAYEDLVEAIRKRDAKDEADGVEAVILSERKKRHAGAKVTYLETWIRETMPKWLDLDPEIIIKRAHEAAENEK